MTIGVPTRALSTFLGAGASAEQGVAAVGFNLLLRGHEDFALAGHGFHDFLRAPFDGEQIGRRRRIGLPPSLLPVFQRGKRNAIGRGKAVL